MNEGWIVLLFIPAFAALWCGVCFLIAVFGGWRTLAETYSLNASAFRGRTWSMLTGRMRISQYKGILNLGADTRGLYMSVFPLFRPGHAPMYIPWDDIDIREGRGFLLPQMEFHFRRHPGLRLAISRNVGEEIAREGNRAVGR